MSPYCSLLSLLTVSAAVANASGGNFSLHFSLPESPFLIDRTLCVYLIGKARCSIAETPLNEDHRSISIDFEGPTHTKILLSISLEKNTTVPWYRRQLAVDSTAVLPIEDGAINVTLKCQKDYFGAVCDIHCVSDSRKICDSHGQFTCQKGWTGPDCDREITTTPAPTTSTSSTTSPLSAKADRSSESIRESSVTVGLLYGLYFGLFLLFVAILCIIFLLIKMNLTISNSFEAIINLVSTKMSTPESSRRNGKASLPVTPIFYTSNTVDREERDSGINNSFFSPRSGSNHEAYV